MKLLNIFNFSFDGKRKQFTKTDDPDSLDEDDPMQEI